MPINARRRAAEFYFRLRARPPLLARTRPPAPPDFVGIGAQRCGTSWWHSLIEAHPRVHALGWPFKELHFFDERTTPDAAAYHEIFRRPAGRIAGEWTPRYMYDAHTPALLRAAAPDAKLLVLLRDPIARFRSGFAHARARGAAPDAAWDDALRRGMYHAQLTNVLASFPREQLLVLQYEQCVASPAAMLAATYEFLGLEPFSPTALDRVVNRGGAAHDDARDDELRAAYANDVAALVRAFPRVDASLWPTVSPA